MKVLAHSSLEPPLKASTFNKSMPVMTFLTILGVKEILCSFRLVLERNVGKAIPESSRLELLEKFLAVLLYQMQKITPSGR